MTFDELLIQASSEDAPRVHTDSRQVEPGDIFVALKGAVCDGHDFIKDAIAAGAGCIISQRPFSSGKTEVIIVEDTAAAAAVLSQVLSGNPASKLINLAVTGTNGKTTVAFMVRSIIEKAGKKCGLISTIAYDTGSDNIPAELTTPDCITIADKQRQMVDAGTGYMITEASSHGLSQGRLAGIDFRAAAFTNLSGDHLDYHKTTENYLAAKSRLFEGLCPQATAVLNKQNPFSVKIAEKTKAKVLWYAVDEPADITAHTESINIDETVFDINYAGQTQTIRTSLLGAHNISNNLAAAGLCLAAGFDLPAVAVGLSAMKAVPGRLEKVDWDGDFTVLVDYAHTDDALSNVLEALRPLCRGKLIVVFGCGGDRDRSKRPRMAAVAERLADILVVTSDNPRTEQPEFIIGEIVTGFEDPTADTVIIEPDRQQAIKMAMQTAGKDDIVLIAGKGHETYQIIGDKKFDFCDKTVAQKYME